MSPKKLKPLVFILVVILAIAAGCESDRNISKTDANIYERYGLRVALPEYYSGKVTAAPEDDLGENTIITLYHDATREKYPTMGWLFSITRCTEEEIIPDAYNPGGTQYFATDGSWYYAITHPTSLEADVSDEKTAAQYALLEDKIEEVRQAFIADNRLQPFSAGGLGVIDFADYDFGGVTSAELIDGTNGERVTIDDAEAVGSIIAYLKTVAGDNPVSARGYYGFYYSVVLYNGAQSVFKIVFLPGNNREEYAFTFGWYETVGNFDYPCRYIMTGGDDFPAVLGGFFGE
ncbi:MAG: hypothetical protein PHZ09_11960 [Eubacteriales bacterium]|nr:hypothetical protein [Eubacteriales bacterium]